MSILNPKKTTVKSATIEFSAPGYADMTNESQNCLVDGNSKKYSPETIFSYPDGVSEYAINKLSSQKTPVYRSPSSVDPAVQLIVGSDVSSTVSLITSVLAKHFSNGYRLNSPIEMIRFRNFLNNEVDEDFTFSDEELRAYIAACGITFEGKIYVVSHETKNKIKDLAENYFATGAQSIFFSEFYTKNENWLFEARVVSANMLIEVLHRLFPQLSFTQTYFGYASLSILTVLEKEILRVWKNHVLLTYSQLAEQLPYIPLDRIKYALSKNGDFIWNSLETFSHINQVEITDDECKTICEITIQNCNAHGYVSITDLPLESIKERNYELSITAIHTAVYQICLIDKFDKKGKIITRKGDNFAALTIMKEYCQRFDKCSLEDLLKFEKELTGESQRQIAMEAGNSVLVRINKENYVADKYFNFDVEKIDQAIELIVKGSYLPLKAFTTFGAFPYCGQKWNLFLLESYCRRFSQKFRFEALAVNSRNSGVIIRKNCKLNYTEIMIEAVANAEVALNETAVGGFLFDSGYIGKSTNAKVREIIDQVKVRRGRKF